MAKKLHKSASTEAHLRQGKEEAIRLQLFEESQPLAEPVGAATQVLEAARDKREKSETALIPIRVTCSLADYTWDKTVRAFAKSVEAQAGGTKTPAYRELFPNGYRPLVTPSGEAQRVCATRFLTHLRACSSPAAKGFCEEWLPKLQQAFDGLAAGLEQRRAAETALYVARAEEQAAKRDFSRTMDKTIAEVRALYPEDRARQDLLFPRLESAAETDDDAEQPSPAAEPAED